MDASIDHDDTALLELLLESDVPEDVQAHGIRTAITEGKTAHLEILLEHGAPIVNPPGETVLNTAVRMLRVEAVALLLEHGARPDETDDEERTALEVALYSRYDYENDENTIRLAGLLLSAGADPDQPHSKWTGSLRKVWRDRLTRMLKTGFKGKSVSEVDEDFASFLATASNTELMESPLRSELHPTFPVVTRIDALMSRFDP